MLCSNELPQLGDASMAIAGQVRAAAARRARGYGREDHGLEDDAARRAAGHPELGARRARAARPARPVHPAARRRRHDARAAGPRVAGRRVRPRPLRHRRRQSVAVDDLYARLARVGGGQRARRSPPSRCSVATCALRSAAGSRCSSSGPRATACASMAASASGASRELRRNACIACMARVQGGGSCTRCTRVFATQPLLDCGRFDTSASVSRAVHDWRGIACIACVAHDAPALPAAQEPAPQHGSRAHARIHDPHVAAGRHG